MKRTFAAAIFAILLMAALMAQKSESRGQTTVWTLTVDRDKAKDEAVATLGDPRTVTVCSDTLNPILLSVDGAHWHQLDFDHDKCVSAPPVRFVKLHRGENDKSTAEVYATY